MTRGIKLQLLSKLLGLQSAENRGAVYIQTDGLTASCGAYLISSTWSSRQRSITRSRIAQVPKLPDILWCELHATRDTAWESRNRSRERTSFIRVL